MQRNDTGYVSSERRASKNGRRQSDRCNVRRVQSTDTVRRQTDTDDAAHRQSSSVHRPTTHGVLYISYYIGVHGPPINTEHHYAVGDQMCMPALASVNRRLSTRTRTRGSHGWIHSRQLFTQLSVSHSAAHCCTVELPMS